MLLTNVPCLLIHMVKESVVIHKCIRSILSTEMTADGLSLAQSLFVVLRCVCDSLLLQVLEWGNILLEIVGMHGREGPLLFHACAEPLVSFLTQREFLFGITD